MAGFVQASVWQTQLDAAIGAWYLPEAQFTTWQVRFDPRQNRVPAGASIKNMPERFAPGKYETVLRYPDNSEHLVPWILNVSRRVPVSSRDLSPGLVNPLDIQWQWVPLNKLTRFVIVSTDNIIGKQLVYSKKRNVVFQDAELKLPLVIHNQDSCSLRVRTAGISVTVPGVALNNGSVGCTIKVLNGQTGRVLEGLVLDSRNVEVLIEP